MVVLVNGERHELDPGATVATALEALSAGTSAQGVAIALDGEVVPRGAWERTTLSEGARIEVVAAVQGG